MTAVLAAALLFNVGQGVLRPAMPLYLQQVFSAHYRMVTLIPVVFGAGKWLASLPTGAWLDRLGRRRLMVAGLLLIAASDLASATAATFAVFLGLRALAGVGWAVFATAATTAMIDVGASRRRGRAVSLLLMSETVGLLLGSTAGGWLYQEVAAASPFRVEAACMVAGAILVGRWTMPQSPEARSSRAAPPWPQLREILHRPGVITMGATSAVLTTVQTGVLVFLFPLYLLERAGLRPGSVGMMVGLGVLGRLVALWLGGGVTTSDGRMRVLARGLPVYAVLLAGLTFLTHPVALVAASVAIGVSAGLVALLPTALVGDLVPADRHGLAIGWLRSMTDTGQILGPLVMGVLADAVDLSTPFLAGAGLVLVVAWRCRRWPVWIAASA